MNSRDNYFLKLIKYIKNVYHIDRQLEHINDKRLNPTYKTSQIISLVLTSFLLRIQSFNQLNCMIKSGEFNSLSSSNGKIPKIDAIRSSLKTVTLNCLRRINNSIIKKTMRNKVLNEGTIDGYNVAAIDGTRLFRTEKAHCNDCLHTSNNGKQYFYHECSVMSLIGDNTNLVIDYEMTKRKSADMKTSQSEIIASKNLLNRVASEHNGFIDVIAYDALALSSPFINECINLNIDVVVRVKKSYILSVKKVKRITNKKECIIEWRDNDYRIKATESIFHMPGVEQPLRYIKFAKKHRNGDRSQVLIVTTAMDMNVKTVYKIMKARWNIENQVFNNLKNNANLNHCFVHGGNAAEAVLYLMFIAYNLFQLFKARRLKNHVPVQKELVRLLLKGLYFYRSCNGYILDTG